MNIFCASIQPNFCANLQNNCREGQVHKSIDELFIIAFREEKLSVLTCQQAMESKTQLFHKRRSQENFAILEFAVIFYQRRNAW